MKILFKDTAAQRELVLPVTPKSFEVETGISVETINIHTLGDVFLPGNPLVGIIKLEVLLPKQQYPFCTGAIRPPYDYIADFEKWCRNKAILRYIITNTPINRAVFVESVRYGQRDGSGDVYATISLREDKPLTIITTKAPTQQARKAEPVVTKERSYTVKKGDTLSAISLKFYGKASLYPKLAGYNGIKNPHLIYIGQIVRLPAISAIGG